MIITMRGHAHWNLIVETKCGNTCTCKAFPQATFMNTVNALPVAAI